MRIIYLNEAAGSKGLIFSVGGRISQGITIDSVDAIFQARRDGNPKNITYENDPQVCKCFALGYEKPSDPSFSRTSRRCRTEQIMIHGKIKRSCLEYETT